MSLTYEERVVQILEKLLDEEIERLKDNLSFGSMQSLDGYTRLVGEIAGLRSAKSLIEEAISIADGKRTREQNA